jgi:hypothetical protein
MSLGILRSVAVGVVACALAACGGKVVFSEGDGGAGGATPHSSSIGNVGATTHASTAATTTGGNMCTSLEAAVEAALTAAQECDPKLNVFQCDGTQILNDTCGCPSVLANEKRPDRIAAAKAATAAWIQAGCGPLQCGKDCFPATSGFCQPNSDGSLGVCTVVHGD